jgi:hypothetical protein
VPYASSILGDHRRGESFARYAVEFLLDVRPRVAARVQRAVVEGVGRYPAHRGSIGACRGGHIPAVTCVINHRRVVSPPT